MVQVHTETAADKMPAYKVVTNYDSMFSDLPQYPSHSYVPIVGGSRGSRGRPLEAATMNSVSSSSGLQVTGKDRALFFKRPVLQLSYVMPLPHIRYAREMSLSVDDVKRNDERNRKRERHLQLQRQRSAASEVRQQAQAAEQQYLRQPRVTFGTQTDFRESEAQTLPCSLNSNGKIIKGELGALSMLRYGRGLPVETSEDLEVVDKLRHQHEKEEKLPPKGDPRRPILQRKLVESKYQIELGLRERASAKTKNWKAEQMRSAVDEWADVSAQHLESRLDRLWKHKQKEKDDRMRKIRRIHEKELKALERKCAIANDRLYGRPSDRSRREFRDTLETSMHENAEMFEPPHQHFSKTSDVGGRMNDSRPFTSSASIRRPHHHQQSDEEEFLNTYNGLKHLERETSRKMSSVAGNIKGRSKSVDDVRQRPYKDCYVPRNQRFTHLLDTAYDDILAKKAADRDREVSMGTHQLFESFRPMDLLSPRRQMGSSSIGTGTPASVISDEEEVEIMQRRATLERLHAEERGRGNQLILPKYKTDDDESGGSVDAYVQVPSVPVPEHPEKEAREAKVEAFLDEIEGETLGQMLNYLSSELETSEDTQATDAELSKRRSEQIDHVFAEITNVTQSAVDRYVDGILLNTIYRHAGQKAQFKVQDQETQTRLKLLRRSSTSDIEQGVSVDFTSSSRSLGVKKRIKEFQKRHLLAAHEALWGVLGEMKAKGEVDILYLKIAFESNF